jgi:hypothetical protein
VDNAVTDPKLRDSAGLSVIGRGANSTGDPADIVAGTNKQVLRREGSDLAFGAVDLSSNQAVTGTLPVNQGGTGITSFGAGVATWLGTPSSANLAAAVTDETGTGALVFANSPTLVTPALGTPASGVVTNLTGTASININGTVGATTPAAGAFTTLNTSGAVVFNEAGANVDFRVESDTITHALFLQGSNGNVGIGTSSPQTKTHIQSSAVSGATYRNSAPLAIERTGDCELQIIATGTSQIRFGDGATNFAGAVSYNHSTDSLLLYTNSSQRMIIDSSGNVGIGASSPEFEISVESGSPVVSIKATTSASPELRLTNTIKDYTNFVDSSGSLIWRDRTAATERLRITSAGNVAIGTTSAPSSLTVQRADATTTFGIRHTTGGTGFGYVFSTSGTSTNDLTVSSEINGVSTERLRINSSGNVGIGTASPDANLTVNGAASFAAGTALLPSIARAGDLNTGIWFPAADTIAASTAGSERLRIDSSGNVGIGTSSPATKLDVAASQPVFRLTDTTTWGAGNTLAGTVTHKLSFYVTDTSGIGAHETAYIGAVIMGSGGGATGEVTPDGELSFATSLYNNLPTERLRLDAFGNLGLGATTPVSLLEVQGGLTTTGAVVTLSSKETSTVVNDVLGRVNFRAALDAAGGDAILTGASIVALAEGTFSSTSNATSLLFQTGSSEAATTKMTLTSAGNLGIGTSSPATPLDVSSSASVIASFRATFAGGGNNKRLTVTSGGDNAALNAVNDSDGTATNMAFRIANTERMRIDSSGSVGIGTTSPNASAILDAQSTTKGVRMPNMTTTEKNAISSPAAGLMVYDTTLAKLCVYTTAWETITSL